MPNIDVPLETAHDIYTEVLALAARDELYLRRNPRTPRLYASGVRYHRGPEWVGIAAVLARGWADCKVLVAWRLAELRLSGVRARPRVFLVRAHPPLWHVVVRMPNGSIEDPSALLGMKGAG